MQSQLVEKTQRIGLTGGIGCGKSTVTHYLAAKGIPIIDADQIARNCVAKGQSAFEQIVKVFGEAILDDKGNLDRVAMRDIVFGNKTKLTQLETIIHPIVKDEIKEQMQQQRGKVAYILVDVPLLIEKDYQPLFDAIWVVDCLPEQQISRGSQRDGVTVAQIQAIMDSQVGREQRLTEADVVLDNTESVKKLEQQLDALHDQLSSLSGIL